MEQYRREQEALVARGAVEGALPARRLTEAWLPRLTAALTARFNQVGTAEGGRVCVLRGAGGRDNAWVCVRVN